MHRGPVDFQMSCKHIRNKTVNLENIGQGACLTLLLLVYISQLTLSFGFFDRSYPRHRSSPVIHFAFMADASSEKLIVLLLGRPVAPPLGRIVGTDISVVLRRSTASLKMLQPVKSGCGIGFLRKI